MGPEVPGRPRVRRRAHAPSDDERRGYPAGGDESDPGDGAHVERFADEEGVAGARHSGGSRQERLGSLNGGELTQRRKADAKAQEGKIKNWILLLAFLRLRVSASLVRQASLTWLVN